MNPTLLLSLAGVSGLKRQITVILVTMVVVVALPVMAVWSLGGSTLLFLSSVPSAEAAASQGFYMGEPVPGDTYAWGHCTYWVFAMRLWGGSSIPTSWGNAATWDERARTDGYVVNHSPATGSIMQTDAGEFGHVAYVTSVDSMSGSWTISEMNAQQLNMVTNRTFSREAASGFSFIHTKKGAPLWIPSPISLP